MNVLFVSRKYPPIIGGMENYAYNLHKQISKDNKVFNIILKKSQINLIWFFPWIFFYGSFLVLFKKIDVVYIGDGVLSPLGLFFQNILKKKVVLTIYGLDVIFNKFFYQKMICFFLPKIKTLVAISLATKEQALLRGVKHNNCTVIPVGINTKNFKILNKKSSIKELQSRYKIKLDNKIILFTIGRLVKRKGVYWYIDNIVEKLNNNYIYIVAGYGDDYIRVKNLIAKKQLQSKVALIGKVDEQVKQLLFSASNIFISSNIIIKNDMEGFGIVNLEAGLFNLPVIASDIEGIKDAIINNVTGFLVPEKNIQAHLTSVKNIDSLNKNHIKKHIENKFSWGVIYLQYLKVFKKL